MTLTGRDILTAIIRDKQCPQRMGLFEHYWEDTLAEWEKQGYPKGVEATDYFNYDVYWLPAWFDTGPIVGLNVTNIIVEEAAETKVTLNGWGTKLRYWKHKSGTPEHISFDMSSREVWEKKYREPLLALNPARFGDIEELKKKFNTRMAEGRFCVYPHAFIFEVMRLAMGDVTLLESMYLDPDWITDFCSVVTDFMILHIDYLFKNVGVPDGYWIYEDMGFTKAPFISPELYRSMIFPHHKKFADFIHSYNIPLIMHSCGKIRPFLPDIAAAGIDCLQVLEAKAGQHVAEFAETVGNKMAFMGNLDIRAFESNDRAKLEAEIVPKLKAVKENKIPYVFHSDHSIPRTVTLDMYRYALDIYKKHCAY
ncbi:MAG: uroporphyrinogen decarboxylase family protein [Chitinivibrionales bacterium]|nr:uroporphyrinogen decarboxylase family protein [Chitinivibrionales bacterium]